jgi:hypothetical protein
LISQRQGNRKAKTLRVGKVANQGRDSAGDYLGNVARQDGMLLGLRDSCEEQNGNG